jgi:hypothetical protein
MADGSGIETHATSSNSTSAPAQPEAGALHTESPRRFPLKRTLLFFGLAAATAGIAYVAVRAAVSRAPADPTTERIQTLIDEANRLLKQLDDKKSD